jgi:hypothetical protein
MASGVFGPGAPDMVPLAEAPPPHPASAPATKTPKTPTLASNGICQLVNPWLRIGPNSTG